MTISKRMLSQRLLFFLVFGLIVLANYLIFLWVAYDRILGAVQKIFYFHVGSAIACYCSFGIVFFASIAYLWKRSQKMDILSEAAGEVGFVFCSIVLASGMIWGHAAWNTWFRWEPRLVSFLLLWLIYLSFNILRIFGDPRKIAAHSAVLGILGTLTVPIVVFSIKILPHTAQLHPEVIAKGGLHPTMKTVLILSMGAIVLLQFLLVWIRTRVGFLIHNREE